MEHSLAIIDLGTNTFHLLVAEFRGGKYAIIHRERTAVKIGLGGINQGIIQEAGISRAIEALRNFKKITDQKNIKKIHAIGTSALRNAKNAAVIIEQVRISLGINIHIISGDEEAELIYKGVRSGVNMGNETSLIMDIGGGSVEFIIGNDHAIFWKQSFEIGAQRLLEKFQKHDPITADEIRALDHYFTESLAALFDALKKFKPSTLVGSSGTFDTLSEIHCIRQHIQYNEENSETPLTIDSFHSIYSELISKNKSERLAIPGMIEMRVEMIVVACCLIRYLLENSDLTTIRVSTYSLKEGVLATLAEKKK